MGAKLQEELSEREANKLPRLMDKPVEDSPCQISPEAGLVCVQPYQGLIKACRRILHGIRSAQSSSDLTDTLSCLKNAKEFVFRIIEG